MKTKNIYIIRHGQTNFNLENKVQGRGINSSINETGQQQAQAFFDAYKDVPFDKIYVSALKRTQESVQQFIDLGIPYESHSGLDEISWGKHEGRPYDPVMHQIYLDTIAGWANGALDMTVGGGESPLEVVVRQKEAMKYIMANEDEEHILIATHGRAMRMLVCWMLNYPLERMDVFEHANLCLYQMQYTGGQYRIVKHGCTAHLPS
ncbi:histidine phosphatase family protein [Reichenbachiella carrageenanivorans]|uniref:Histidine phosphatase family protein n=1 Tax=Reichenbachiella carrageenanivorans TaxID=2979869 RepID=A0ABY6CZR3_9BACT|nr:histidine phosphatase family protein [Reichenbachiella carrageenanivorans]UXX78934.1 histidine phosphatase family protein [Reichenbachiella carrageenanivorans]